MPLCQTTDPIIKQPYSNLVDAWLPSVRSQCRNYARNTAGWTGRYTYAQPCGGLSMVPMQPKKPLYWTIRKEKGNSSWFPVPACRDMACAFECDI